MTTPDPATTTDQPTAFSTWQAPHLEDSLVAIAHTVATTLAADPTPADHDVDTGTGIRPLWV